MTETDLMALLDQLGIRYSRIDHPPVFTVEEADLHLKGAPGLGTKNLFLKTEKGDHFLLLVVLEHKKVDLNRLGRQLGVGNLRFGSADKLREILGLEPGSVTVLAVVNDVNKKVKVLVDLELWRDEGLQCHPLINTATLVIQPLDISRLLAHSGHDIELITIPVRAT
jgi:Ala-tRNA(Pro) deacylase